MGERSPRLGTCLAEGAAQLLHVLVQGPQLVAQRAQDAHEAVQAAGRLNIPKSGFCRVCGGWGRGEAAGSLFSAWCQVRSSRCQESCSGLGRTGRWRAGPSLLFGVCCVDVEVCWLQPPSLRRGCRGCGGGRGSGGLAPPQAWSWWSSLRSGLRPSAGCAGLTTGLLPQGVLSQATGGHAAGGLVGGFRVLCRLQHCGHEWEGGLPEKEAGPPVTRVSLGDTWGVGNGFRGALGTTAGAVAGSGTQAALRGEVPSAARGAGTPSPPALRGPAGGAQLLLPALPDQPPVHVRLPPAFISGLSGGFASSSSSFVKKSSVPSMSSVFQRSFLSSLVPPALDVPQHVFWALVDVPQGEFAEQLARVLGAGHDVRFKLCIVESLGGADQPLVLLAAGVDLELRQAAGQLLTRQDAPRLAGVRLQPQARCSRRKRAARSWPGSPRSNPTDAARTTWSACGRSGRRAPTQGCGSGP
uniref:uncharacterized protein LOC128931544 n=1 Tax=Callithrix jacchus TaxID=9483 RepID=UPI0023DD3E0E|nr:uncharacterized protein LOC128931544 [Callithrix jacchus]